MTNLNNSSYQQFSIQERINLTISALSRGDMEEAKKLRRSCPRKKYMMIDHEYTKALETLPWIAVFFEKLHNFYYYKILLCRAAIAIYNIDPQLSHEASSKVADLNKSEIRHISHFKAIYNGFYSFCDDAKLDKDHLMLWLKIDPLQWVKFIGLHMIVEPDDEFSIYVKEELLAIWNNEILDFN